MVDRSGPPVLEIRDLCVSYFTRAGEIPAVVDFSLDLWPGESVGLVGESGCGKSTVALAIMQYMGRNGGIVGGTIRYKGQDLGQLGPRALRRIRGPAISMVCQEPMTALNPCLTLGRQLTEVLVCHEKIPQAEARTRAVQALEDVQLPDPDRLMAAWPHQISGGQQQRVVIAMALLSSPGLLLLDEPTTALDVTVEAGIVRLIAGLAARHDTALLYISHNLGLILDTCDRVCVMYSGEVVEEGAIKTVFVSPKHPYTHGLFGCIPLPQADKNAAPLVPIRGQLPLPHQRPPGCNFGPRCDFFEAGRCDAGPVPFGPVEGGQTDRAQRVRCRRYREIEFSAAAGKAIVKPPVEIGETVLEVDGLQKYYAVHDRSIGAMISGAGVRYVKANEALDFSARRGEIVAIVGESGCGKSTFARVLMGLESATGGEVRYLGEDLGRLSVRDRSPGLLGSLQMVFQNPDDTLNPAYTVGSQIMRVIRKIGVADNAASARQIMLDLLDTVKLPREFADRLPRQLSGGQKQRVGIARAFAGNPALVVADEPVSALDVSVAAAVTGLLMDIQRKHGTTLLFISHDLSVVRYLADRVVVMYLGQIMESGTTGEVFSSPCHPYTEALLSAVPIADPAVTRRGIVLEGSPPGALDPPAGCPFSTRCQHRLGDICDNQRPPVMTSANGHRIACHIPVEELARAGPVIRAPGEGSAGRAVPADAGPSGPA